MNVTVYGLWHLGCVTAACASGETNAGLTDYAWSAQGAPNACECPCNSAVTAPGANPASMAPGRALR